MGESSRRRTWWIPVLVALAWAAAMWSIWGGPPAPHRQSRVIWTYAISAVGAALAVLWVLFLAGLGRRGRIAVLGLLAAGGLFAVCAIRIRGVTGDLVPILEWRFTRAPEAALEPRAASVPRGPGREASRPVTWREYPQFLGPTRSGTLPGARLARDWTAAPPRLLWKREVGAAWSGFAVRGHDAVTQEQSGDRETVTCYDLLTGELRWAHAYPARFDKVLGGIGPRATPTIGDDAVFALGATGALVCVDRRTGEKIWDRNILADNGGEEPPWGTSGSPLVLGDLVVVSAGGPLGRSLVAYHAGSGEPIWWGGTDRSGYSSPAVSILSGTPQILILNQGSVAGHELATGRVLWRFPWPDAEPNVAQPVVVGEDALVVSSGYGVGASLLRVSRRDDGFAVEEAWHSISLKAKFANFVHRGGFLFGLDDGILACVEVATGERRWKGGRYGHGQLILAEDLLLLSAEAGYLALVEATPEAHREVARHPALEEKTWNSPALAAPYLLVRNDRQAACYEVALEE